MKVSVSIDVVWQLAQQEAIAARFGEIEPEHFLEALLKFAELSTDEVGRISGNPDVARMLAVEGDAVRRELEKRSIDGALVRRALRAGLGTGKDSYDGGTLHRSPAARELFDAVGRLAEEDGSDVVTAPHFLKASLSAPSPAMEKALREAGSGSAGSRGTPLLDELGTDFTRMAAEGELIPDRGRKAEGRAMLQALSRGDGKSVLLVASNDGVARLAVGCLSAAMGGEDCPPSLRGSRVIDVSQVPEGDEAEDPVARFERIFQEASSARNVILFVPGVEAESAADGPWIALLKETLSGGSPRCILRVSPKVYESLIHRDPEWKRLGSVMWIADDRRPGVPKEL